MPMQQTHHVHYAPSSVGALMDPGFLRGAVLDAESESHHDEAAAGAGLRAGCRAALRIAASVFRPRSGPPGGPRPVD